ncbi:MAG: response regulator [Proteobacteria bacterium]|nr:response regulator [Pseudomonadota bacterium]
MSKPPIRILVVDDDPDIVMMLATRLNIRGYQVSTAHDGNQALEMIDREPPDLILLDVMMPGKTGWDVIRTLKQAPVTQAIKVVMVSAIGEVANEAAAWKYGADGHIDKPFEFSVVEAMIKRLVVVPAD